MQRPLVERMVLVQQQVPQEQLQGLRRLVNAFYQIAVICPDEGIAKVPGVFGKNTVGRVKAEEAKIPDKEYRRRSGVSLLEGMDLPQPRNEYREMADDPVHGQVAIGKASLLGQVVFQRRHELRRAAIEHRFPVEHPFPFADIMAPDVSRMGKDARKQPPVDGQVFVRREAERPFRQERRDPGRDLVRLLGAILRASGRVFS